MSDRVSAAILAVAAVCLSAWFAVSLPSPDAPGLRPAFQGLNPDEGDHVSYAKKLSETKSLVRFPADEIRKARESGGDGHEWASFAETHQPPLYYAIGALLGGSLAALRRLSVLLGAATVVLAYVAARDLFPARREIAWGVAGILATLPAFAQLSGAASNDTFATLISTGVFWRLGRIVKNGSTLRESILLGLWLGAGLWTKLTALQLFPAVLLAYGISTGKRPGRWVGALVSVAVALVFASPWLARNALLYGDPLNLKIFPLTAPLGTPTPASMQAVPQLGLTPLTYLWLVVSRSFATFFYILPPNGPLWPKPGPALLVALTALLGLVGAAKAAQSAETAERRVLILFAAAPLLILPFFAGFNLRFFQAQGRYFHPALFPVCCLLAFGISTLAGPKQAGRALLALCALFAILSALQVVSLCQTL